MKTLLPISLNTALFLTVSALFAAEPTPAPAKPKAPQKPKVEHKVYLTPADAGPDLADQGEYAGAWGGAQVIALGDAKFRAVFYQGGLPGAGWDKSPKVQMDGKREESAIVFSGGNGGKGQLTGGTFTATLPGGTAVTLNRTTRVSPTLGAKPPGGAVVLFDGSDVDGWAGGKMDARGLLQAGTKSKAIFTNFSMHLEFLLPFKPTARGQERGNSGVYMQDRYEIQVLDSFGLSGQDNECGGIYSIAKPALNLCFPPLTWQTYDIRFRAAQYDDTGKKLKNAVVTVKHNGVTIHEDQELKQATGGGSGEKPSGGPIQLQGHGNPVFFRNIWVVPQ